MPTTAENAQQQDQQESATDQGALQHKLHCEEVCESAAGPEISEDGTATLPANEETHIDKTTRWPTASDVTKTQSTDEATNGPHEGEQPKSSQERHADQPNGHVATTSPMLGERIMVVDEAWLSHMLCGSKTLELRNTPATPGHTWLAWAGHIYGVAHITESIPMSAATFEETRDQHQHLGKAPSGGDAMYGLVLTKVARLPRPVQYYRSASCSRWHTFRTGPYDKLEKTRRRTKKENVDKKDIKSDVCDRSDAAETDPEQKGEQTKRAADGQAKRSRSRNTALPQT